MQEKKKIKVAHVITRLIIGGAQENTLYTVDSLQKDPRFDVVLVSGETLGPEGKLYETGEFKLEKLYVSKGLTREISPINDLRAFVDLYLYFKKEKFDIVHTHSSKAGIIGRIAAYLAGVPKIYHTVHGLPFHDYEKAWRNFVFITLERFCALLSTKILTVCRTMTRKCLEKGVGRKSKYQTVYSGMDIERYSPTMDEKTIKEKRRELGIPEYAKVFVKVARLFELKGHEYVIEIAKDIVKKHPEAFFVFVGDGILREELENMVEKNDLKDNFLFTGLVPPSDVPFFIELSDAVIHTSLREGLARVIPQGFLMGKPVISFDVDGAGELVRNGKTGFLVPEKDLDCLKKSVRSVLEDYEKAKEMALKGQRICKDLYPYQKMGQEIIEIYIRDLR